MQYVVVLEIDEAKLDGDDSIENACRYVNDTMSGEEADVGGITTVHLRPLSEIIAS